LLKCLNYHKNKGKKNDSPPAIKEMRYPTTKNRYLKTNTTIIIKVKYRIPSEIGQNIVRKKVTIKMIMKNLTLKEVGQWA